MFFRTMRGALNMFDPFQRAENIEACIILSVPMPSKRAFSVWVKATARYVSTVVAATPDEAVTEILRDEKNGLTGELEVREEIGSF